MDLEEAFGKAPAAARTFVFRYILPGLAALAFASLYHALFFPAALGVVIGFAKEASAAFSVLLVSSLVGISLTIRAVSIDRWFFVNPYADIGYIRLNKLASTNPRFDGLKEADFFDPPEPPVLNLIIAPYSWLKKKILERVAPGLTAVKTVRGRAIWLHLQHNVMESRALAFFEAEFLWWANLSTVIFFFGVASMATFFSAARWIPNAMIAPWPALIAAWSVSGLLFIGAVIRMWSNFKMYMHEAVVALWETQKREMTSLSKTPRGAPVTEPEPSQPIVAEGKVK